MEFLWECVYVCSFLLINQKPRQSWEGKHENLKGTDERGIIDTEIQLGIWTHHNHFTTEGSISNLSHLNSI